VVIVPALVVGWFAVRGRVLAVAQERIGYTGQFPVIANRPLSDRDMPDRKKPDGGGKE
jgi:L-asparagine permease